VADGAEEAQCPQCGETLVWRSCLDTNEVFTVLKRWETFVHPGCDTQHPVDLSHVISAARPQNLDPSQAPIAPPGGEQTVYSPVEIAPDVEWADQQIVGRLIVDSERVAILPAPGNPRPPLSVAWLRDVQDFTVLPAGGAETGDKKRKLFGRKGKDEPSGRPSVLVLSVPGGQIALAVGTAPEALVAQAEQALRPRIGTTGAPAQPAPQPPAPQDSTPQQTVAPDSAPVAGSDQPGEAPTETPSAPDGSGVSVGAAPPPVAGEVLAAPSAQGPTAEAPAVPAAEAPIAEPAAAPAGDPAGASGQPVGLANLDPSRVPDLNPKTPEGVYESIRKLAELAVLGEISSEEFASTKAQLLAKL
jgi:hypothetical protein